jgi:hypothetical protein
MYILGGQQIEGIYFCIAPQNAMVSTASVSFAGIQCKGTSPVWTQLYFSSFINKNYFWRFSIDLSQIWNIKMDVLCGLETWQVQLRLEDERSLQDLELGPIGREKVCRW